MSQAAQITSFFHADTCTFSYLIADPATRRCAVVDPVLDYDPADGRTRTDAADAIVASIRRESWQLEWILETHVHADHLSAGDYLRHQLGGRLAIGAQVVHTQRIFGELFNAGAGFSRDGSQFDHLFADGDRFAIGTLAAEVIHTPGHTPACVTYRVGDAAFIGDTLFMPDYGTARCDFPGGDAGAMYRSIQRLYALPPNTVLYLCHDYLPAGRSDYRNVSSVAEQRAGNIHLREGIDEAAFVALRRQRDAGLAKPRLLLPSVQVNMRGGQLPPVEGNGVSYLKIPLNRL